MSEKGTIIKSYFTDCCRARVDGSTPARYTDGTPAGPAPATHAHYGAEFAVPDPSVKCTCAPTYDPRPDQPPFPPSPFCKIHGDHKAVQHRGWLPGALGIPTAAKARAVQLQCSVCKRFCHLHECFFTEREFSPRQD